MLNFCHASPFRGHLVAQYTARKVLDCGFFWPTIFRDAWIVSSMCERCQRASSGISKRQQMPQQHMLFCEVFDVWGIDFMSPFPVSFGFTYILLVVDYVSKWVEAIATRTNDSHVVAAFIRSNLFCKFEIPKAIISDQGTHFCNRLLDGLFRKNGQVEVSNREIKRILEKMVNPTRKDSSKRLNNAIWAHCTAYKALIGMSPFRVVFGKACHLPVEIEHKAYWAIKPCNMNYDKAGEQQKLQLQELDKIRLEEYENSKFYKERTKSLHDHFITSKEFLAGQRVLMFNFRLKLMPGKLRSRWIGPFFITHVHPHGAVELQLSLIHI